MHILINKWLHLFEGQQWDEILLATLATIGLLWFLTKLYSILSSTFIVIKLYLIEQFNWRAKDLSSHYGQWAVVTGATDGIGLAMCKELIKRGISLIIIARNQEKLNKTKEELLKLVVLKTDEQQHQSINSSPIKVETIQKDFSDTTRESYAKMIDLIDPLNRDIGILINNVGIYSVNFESMLKFKLNYLREQVDVNVLSVLEMTHAILPGMLNRSRGLVINVSSIITANSAAFTGVYGPTKSFVDSFSKQLQVEYSNHPVDIINLTTGPVMSKVFTEIKPELRRSALVLTSDTYAKSVINIISSKLGMPRSFAGAFIHVLQRNSLILLEYLGASRAFMVYLKKKYAEDIERSGKKQINQLVE